MKRIMFICHGNICRSTMAEFVMKDMVHKANKDSEYYIVSRATSTEEIGNSIHYGTRQVLDRENIPYDRNKVATRVKMSDYDDYDLFIIMDENNRRNLVRQIGGKFASDSENKVHMLLEYVGLTRDVDDPWYTHRFDDTYRDITMGCNALYSSIEENLR